MSVNFHCGDYVTEKEGSHIGQIIYIHGMRNKYGRLVSGEAKVRWCDAGWISTVDVFDLEKVKAETAR